MLKIAKDKDLLDVRVSNIRNFTYNKHRSVDDRPYGGGPGMLLKPEPIARAVEAVGQPLGTTPVLVLLTPQGRVFNQEMARQFSKEKHLVLVCGHYEGFDDRIREEFRPHEISIGDYVLTGGEIPAMVIVDTVARLIPGVLGSEESPLQESHGNGLLEYPQYTRPPIWRGRKVPEVLISGHHQKIKEWQEQQAQQRTRERRPDLWE